MEDTHGVHVRPNHYREEQVLILIVMEDTHGDPEYIDRYQNYMT